METKQKKAIRNSKKISGPFSNSFDQYIYFSNENLQITITACEYILYAMAAIIGFYNSR